MDDPLVQHFVVCFWRGRGPGKGMVCTLEKMLIFMDDPLFSSFSRVYAREEGDRGLHMLFK